MNVFVKSVIQMRQKAHLNSPEFLTFERLSRLADSQRKLRTKGKKLKLPVTQFGKKPNVLNTILVQKLELFDSADYSTNIT